MVKAADFEGRKRWHALSKVQHAIKPAPLLYDWQIRSAQNCRARLSLVGQSNRAAGELH